MHTRPGILLDRDGTLVEEVNYLSRIEDIRLIEGAVEAVRLANQLEIPVVVVSNQSGVARGFLSEREVEAINRAIGNLLVLEDARIDAFYYCPHHPTLGDEPYRKDCTCRKPNPGLLLQAADDLGLDLERSVMIGDSFRDLEAGRRVGCAAVLVLTGHGRSQYEHAQLAGSERCSDFVAEGIGEAMKWAIEFIRTGPK